MNKFLHIFREKSAPSEDASLSVSPELHHRVRAWLSGRTYLDSTMTIGRALEEIGTDADSLYIYLHDELHMDGYRQWIAYLRIEAAKQFMHDHPEYTLETIAEMCGFSERSNFSRAFKNQTGDSPQDWLRVHR